MALLGRRRRPRVTSHFRKVPGRFPVRSHLRRPDQPDFRAETTIDFRPTPLLS